MIFAGLPTTTFLSGITISLLTNVKAPTIHSSPIIASSKTTAFIPIIELNPIVAPCTIEPCPKWAPSFMVTVTPGNM